MNTAIAALMAMVNEFYSSGLTRGDLQQLMLLLSPFAPHMVEEMWELTGYAGKTGKMAMQMPWPAYDEGKTVDTHVDMAIQVNGKLKGAVTVPAGSDQETVMAAAMEQGQKGRRGHDRGKDHPGEGQAHEPDRQAREIIGIVKNVGKRLDKAGPTQYNAIVKVMSNDS